MPTPASPRTVTTRQDRSSTTWSTAERRRASSTTRPTSGVSTRRVTPAAPGSTSWSRQAATGSDFPFSSSGGIASATTASRTSLMVESPTRISPPAGCGFEPLRDDDSVAGRERVPLLRVARDHLAGVDARAHLDPDAVGRLEPVVQLCERLTELDRGPDGAQRVVLVHDRDPESGHDRVTDELLDRAAVPLQHLAGSLVIARPDTPKRLGIEAFPQRRRICDVTEDERDGLPDHEISLGRVESDA